MFKKVRDFVSDKGRLLSPLNGQKFWSRARYDNLAAVIKETLVGDGNVSDTFLRRTHKYRGNFIEVIPAGESRCLCQRLTKLSSGSLSGGDYYLPDQLCDVVLLNYKRLLIALSGSYYRDEAVNVHGNLGFR